MDFVEKGHSTSSMGKNRTLLTLLYWVRLVIVLLWGSGFLITAIAFLLSWKASRVQKVPLDRILPAAQYSGAKKPLTFEALRDGEFRPELKHVQWIHSPESVSNDQGTYLLSGKVDGTTKYVVKSISNESYLYDLYNDSFFSYGGQQYEIDELFASPDLSKALLRTNTTKGWRHSSTAIFWVLDVQTSHITPLHSDSDKISTTLWSPNSQEIAFVLRNDIYVKKLESGAVTRITADGSANIFNGKPDWVYEEEVFASDIVMWWSPQGDKLAFLKFNDTLVPEFTIPYYVQPGHDEYPELVSIKYPKPGYTNPTVELVVASFAADDFLLHQASLESEKISEKLITEVLWVSDDFVLVKTSNRASDLLEVFLVSADDKASATLIRSHRADKSWFEVTSNAVYVPKNESLGRNVDGYVDIVVQDGFSHLAYFYPPQNPHGVLLTLGQWEVLTNQVDLRNNVVYFTATLESSVQRHFYSVNLLDAVSGDAVSQKLTNGTSWYSGSFSSGSRYLLLNYLGPGVPSQRLVDLHTMATVKTIETNAALRKVVEEYDLPHKKITTVDLGYDEASGGKIEANVMETLPLGFDPKKKYPVLFYVYGGPGSQLVTNEFAVGFSEIVAAQLNAVVVTVDGRGTGYNNRNAHSQFKFCVRDQLGHYESIDQISAAKVWANKSYVDADRIAIWGWSYGGFLTLKTLESDSDHVFSYGVAVAPVTKWRLYDSVYTERYLRTPQENPEGYATASIRNAEVFKDVKRFLIMHGSGDDNVHFQNSLRLLDEFNLATVENYDFMVFPDSDHSIRYHNGNSVVYDRILGWLRRAFSDDFV